MLDLALLKAEIETGMYSAATRCRPSTSGTDFRR
jgi:hypothetical protein